MLTLVLPANSNPPDKNRLDLVLDQVAHLRFYLPKGSVQIDRFARC